MNKTSKQEDEVSIAKTIFLLLSGLVLSDTAFALVCGAADSIQWKSLGNNKWEPDPIKHRGIEGKWHYAQITLNVPPKALFLKQEMKNMGGTSTMLCYYGGRNFRGQFYYSLPLKSP